MPDISQMKNSTYLGKGDLEGMPHGILGSMLNVTQENVAKRGEAEELKWCLHFSNIEKPMVLNSINMQLIAQATGSTRTEEWAGKQIVIFLDPTVSMGGKIVGGLRCRAVKRKAVPASAPAPVPTPAPAPVAAPAPQAAAPDEGDDDVPF